MVIAMTRDEVCDLFNSNPCLTLPIIVETGSSVQGELEKRWDSFFEFLHRTEALYSCIEPAEYSREKITDAFKNYYAGDFGKASENLFDIVKTLIDKYRCKNLITDISSLYIGNESKNWFRARTGTFYPFSKDDMKHIPTDKREFIGSNRYSSNGIPCLYLANSILTCWEELNRPSLDSFWVSRFWPVKEIRVLNLSVTGYEIINAQQYIRTVSENKDAYDQVVVDFFSTWVLQSACSVAVRSKANRLFREEYLIPQLLMQNVKRFDANAIMYFSTKTPLLIGDKEIATNFQTSASWIAKAIALPVFETTGDRFSAQINEDFAVSLPINIGLYQNHLMPQEPPFISDENWSRISAPAYITLAPRYYIRRLRREAGGQARPSRCATGTRYRRKTHCKQYACGLCGR